MPAKEKKLHKYTQPTQEAFELYYVSHTYTLFHPIYTIEYQEQMCGSSKKNGIIQNHNMNKQEESFHYKWQFVI